MINYDVVNRFIGKEWIYLKFDCYALVKQASKEIFGVEIKDQISFSEEPDLLFNANTFNEQKTKPCWSRVDEPSAGVVAMFYDVNKSPSHIGLMIDKSNVLHCLGGLSIRNGKCRYDEISLISRIYKSIEYYKYVE